MRRARTSYREVRHTLARQPYYLCAQVGHVGASAAAVMAVQRRTFITSLAGSLPKGDPVVLKARMDEVLKFNGMAQNFLMLPDLPARTDHASRSDILEALHALNIRNDKITLIVSSDNVGDASGVEDLGRFLVFERETRGAFRNVLVVKGSSGLALKVSHRASLYGRMCRMVQEAHPGRLALVMNPYMPYTDFLEEIRRKSEFMPVKYFTQPIFDPHMLPMENRRLIEEWMRRGSIKLSVGMLALDHRMYLDQRMTSVTDSRVAASGRDKYILPEKPTDLAYLKLLPDWLRKHHPEPADAIYTRWGFDHDSSAILRILQGTEFDASFRKAPLV